MQLQRKNLVLTLGVAILGFAAIFFLSSYIENHRVSLPASYEDNDLSFQGKRLKGFALGAEGRVAVMGPLGLAGALRLIVPTRRETFGLDEIGVLHRPGPVSGRVELGLSVLF